MRIVRPLALLLLSCFVVNGRPNSEADDDYDFTAAEPEPGVQNDNYDYDGAEDEDNVPPLPNPTLISQPKNLIVKENDTVRLPCDIENGDSLVAMWKKNNELIFQDTIKFQNFGNNFQLANRSLIITNVGANETANYTCSIPLSGTEKLDVTHQLFVQTAPKIELLRALHDVVQLDSGKTLVLTCRAAGYPKPTIKWSRKGQRLNAEGETLTIENISHHDAGDYQCLADNNIEPPAHQYIHISVVHKPVVKLEKLTVNSDTNLDSQLICYVHAVPKPDVVWKKDGINVVANERKHLKHYNHTYILEIIKVQSEDFGVYTCSAYNRVGRSDKNVTLTGFPSPAEHIGTFHHSERHIVLIWNVESNSPVTEHSLDYKKIADSDWKNVIPEVKNPEGNFYTINYTLSDLPNGHYESRVRSRNMYGWSDYSNIVKFKSAHHHNVPHVPEQVTLKEESVPSVLIHEQEYSFGNEISDQGKPIVVQATEQPPLIVADQVPDEAHTQNSEHKPQTQEQHPQAGTQAKGDSSAETASILPVSLLICIAALSTIYSR